MVVIIHGGHREGLCFNAARAFERILQENGTSVQFFSLRDYDFKFCCGDQPCQTSGECIYNDLLTTEIIPAIAKCDTLFIFTPTYFNLPPALLKNFIDRCNLLLTIENRKRPQFGAWVSGQTEYSIVEECYSSLATFAEICEMEPFEAGKIIHVETDIQQMHISQDDINELQKLAGCVQ